MKRRLKSAVSILLAVVMIVSMLPVTAFAVEAPSLSGWAQKKAEALEDSGYEKGGPFRLQGSDLYQFTFTKNNYDDEGNLTQDAVYLILPGTDAVDTEMPDYGEPDSPTKPWAEANPSAVYIADGVTGIGAHAFENMRNLEKLEIENSETLKKVGAYAFNGCDNLDGPLDLSGVTDLGEYAFNACERLDSVTLSDDLTSIPKNAFNSCGLTSVNIPAKVKTIGDAAFANNSLSGELVLPDTLTTIGDSAFYRYLSSSDIGGYSSITIPASVTSIGKNAFSGHKSLETVTLQHTDASKLTIKDGAFGTDTYTAHNYVTDVTVDDGSSTITYKNVSMGTNFLTQNEKVANLLTNGVNCYQGNLKPLKYRSTTPATCAKDGYHVYTMTLTGVSTDGKDVTMDTKIMIPAVGHNYVKRPDLPATCTYAERTLEECTNVKNSLVQTCEQSQKIAVKDGGQAALGHDYRVTGVTSPTIAGDNDGNTVVTYTCSHYSEKEENNRHDGYPATYAWEIKPTTLTASTSHRLIDLVLPEVNGVGENTIGARLVWDEEGSTTSALLTAGTHKYKVKLDITGTESTFPDYADPEGNFLITVQVEKEKLDFSNVKFENATRYTGLNNPDFKVTGMPEGTTITRTEYCKNGEDDWTATKPAEANASDAAEYQVRITFTYEDDKYLLALGLPELLPDSAYRLAAGSDGKSGTITGDYVVRALSEADLTVTAKSGLVYDKTKQNTVTVSGIPSGAEVTVSWKEDGQLKTETIASAELSSYDVAGITNAGSYEITVRVEHSGFTGDFVEKTVTGTIAKQTVTTPRANTGLKPYTPQLTQTGVPDSTDTDIYTVSNNKQENAGVHTAEAVLVHPSNYKWSTGDSDQDGTTEISYNIPRRTLQKPTLVLDRYPFTGEPIRPLQRNNRELDGTFDGDGKLTAYWENYGESYVAYTATQAQMTDAGNYTITITLNNNDTVKNYRWQDGTDTNVILRWEITRRQINAPTVTVSSAEYTGAAYDAAANIKLTKHSDNSQGILTLGSSHTYYTSSTGSTPMPGAPVNAGTYYVLVDFGYEAGLKPGNYQIIGNDRKRFTITRATAALSFDQPEQSATYTAGGTALQQAKVSGLVAADQNKTPSEIYSIAYTYKYSTDSNPNWGSIEPIAVVDPAAHKFTQVGYYQITAGWGAGTASDNYTAKDAVYTLTITPANNQSIVLTPDEAARWTEASGQTPANYTITFGDAATFTVTGKAALDNAAITYEVASGDDFISIADESKPTVTILKAGTATVTVSAVKTSNVDETFVTYTVTVNKASPTVEVVMPEGGGDDNTYGYTGTPLTFSATVKGPGGVTQPVTDGKLSYKYYTDNGGTCGGEILDGQQPTNVGSYWVSAVYSGDGNYAAAVSDPVKVTISAAVLDVTVNNIYKGTYDGHSHDAARGLTVIGNGQNITGSAAITYATEPDGPYTEGMPQFKDAGEHTVYYKVNAANYEEKTDSFTVTISPAELTITRSVKTDRTYDGTRDAKSQVTAVSITGNVGGDVPFAVTVEHADYTGKNVETADQKITIVYRITGTELSNYTVKVGSVTEDGLTGATGTVTEVMDGKITPLEITVTGVDAVDRPYDGTTDVALKISSGGLATTSDIFNHDKANGEVSLALTQGATGTADSEDYTGQETSVTVPTTAVTLEGAGKGNFTVSSVANTTAIISRKDVTIDFGDSPMKAQYGSVTEEAYKAKISGTVSGESHPGAITYTFYEDESGNKPITGVPSNVGVYYVKASVTAEGNYNGATTGIARFEITAAGGLVVTAQPYSKVYDGNDHPAAVMTVKAGDADLSGSDYTIYYAETPIAVDADLTGLSTEMPMVRNVSDSGTIYYLVVTQNYGREADSFEVEITKADFTVDAQFTTEKIYDKTNSIGGGAPTASASGLVKDSDVTSVAVSAVYKSAQAGTEVGIDVTCTITFCNAEMANNYNVPTLKVNGTAAAAGSTNGQDDELTVSATADGKINPKPVTVTVMDKSKVYDGTAPSVTSDKGSDWTDPDSGIIGDDDLGVTLSVTGSDKDAGTYEINGTWTNQNYKVTFNPGEFQIDPRNIKVTIGHAEGVYGDMPDLSKVVLTYQPTTGNAGLAPNEHSISGISLSAMTAAAGGTPVDGATKVGKYVIAGTDNNNNYNVTFVNGSYTVKVRPVTVTIADKESLYGQDTVQLTCSVTGGSMANGEDLGITLETTAVMGSDAGIYAISEKSRNTAVAANYAVTVQGETAFGGDSTKATYTVKKAGLTVAFTDPTVNAPVGGSVNNPLKFTNASSGTELGGQPGDVTVEYTSSAPSVATVDIATGEVTIIGPGDATITATVMSGGNNFNAGAAASYELRIATAGQGIQVSVQPNALTYNGSAQALVTSNVLFPTDRPVTIEYSLDGQSYSTDIPTGINAGSYTVYWRASAGGYTDVSGSALVSIAKANPSKGFSDLNVQTTYEENKVFDSTKETALDKAADYDGAIHYLSNDTQVAKVNGNDLANISINSTGSAVISASFEETENYNAQSVSFTLTVTNSDSTIQYSAEDYKVTYDRQPHGADITVTSPSNYTIMYSDNGGSSYELTDSPVITSAGKLTIYYRISAPGYTSVHDTQTVEVEAKPIDDSMISGIAESYTYTGQQITVPTLTVTDGSALLVEGEDYEVEYGDNIEVGQNSGSVKITGIGNYSGSVTKYFEITAVEASYLSASLDRYFGYYGDSNTNTATVTVMHGGHEVTEDVTVTVNSPDCSVNGQTVTFNAVGVYTIQVEVTGSHTGSFTLYYTLLPKENGGDFEISGLPGSVVTYDGQNHAFTPAVSTADDVQLVPGTDYTLTYSYTPFSGTEVSDAPYDPDATEMVEAGLYTVTVTGIGNHSGNASIALLITQRNLADDGVDPSIDTGLIFSGSAQEPQVTLTYNDETLTGFTTKYYNNVNAGMAQAVSTADAGNNNFTGTRVDEFPIARKSIESGFTAVADPAEYNYTGNVIVPTVIVEEENGNRLLLNTDYTVKATGSAPGDYKATVTGIGNYTGQVEVDYTILSDPGQPVTGLELAVTPDRWTYGDGTVPEISVTYDGNAITNYTLTVEKDGKQLVTNGTLPEAIAVLMEPGIYTITANGADVYSGSSDTAVVTIDKIQPQLSITATPSTLSGGGIVKLTIHGANLPAGTDLKTLLSVATVNGTQVDLAKLTWTEEEGGYTAELDLDNEDETYTFTLAYPGDSRYASAQDTATVVTAQQISGGGGGSITPPVEEPDDGVADPDDTGVSDWLITGEHVQYLKGYGNDLFGPTDNMSRAQVAQMFYNLLKDKDVPITVSFTDVPADAWYAESVGVLASIGILNGVGGGRYEPTRSITRAEFTAIAMRFARVDTSGADIFPDVNADDWFYDVVVSAVTYGWINGYADGTFRPNNTIARAEVTAIVNRMLGRSADKAYVDAHGDELTQFTDVSQYYWAYYEIMEATNAHDYTQKGGTETWRD